MNQTKKWYQSNVIWSIVVAFISFLMSGIGVADAPVLPPNADAEQLKAYYELIKNADGNVNSIISSIIGGVSLIYAIISRITSSKRIA